MYPSVPCNITRNEAFKHTPCLVIVAVDCFTITRKKLIVDDAKDMATKDPDSQLLDELCARFVFNAPATELESFEKLMFLVEQAHWFYEDFCRQKRTNLKSFSLREFAVRLFKHCPGLIPFHTMLDTIYFNFNKYKATVPTMGAILLSDNMDKVLLVRGLSSNKGWGFPKGKVAEAESDVECAVREVMEETGLDISHMIDETEFIQVYVRVRTAAGVRQQRAKLFVVQNVDEQFGFHPTVKGEVGAYGWFRIDELPASFHATKLVYQNTDGGSHRFFLVYPFVNEIRAWVVRKKLGKGMAVEMPAFIDRDEGAIPVYGEEVIDETLDDDDGFASDFLISSFTTSLGTFKFRKDRIMRAIRAMEIFATNNNRLYIEKLCKKKAPLTQKQILKRVLRSFKKKALENQTEDSNGMAEAKSCPDQYGSKLGHAKHSTSMNSLQSSGSKSFFPDSTSIDVGCVAYNARTKDRNIVADDVNQNKTKDPSAYSPLDFSKLYASHSHNIKFKLETFYESGKASDNNLDVNGLCEIDFETKNGLKFKSLRSLKFDTEDEAVVKEITQAHLLTSEIKLTDSHFPPESQSSVEEDVECTHMAGFRKGGADALADARVGVQDPHVTSDSSDENLQSSDSSSDPNFATNLIQRSIQYLDPVTLAESQRKIDVNFGNREPKESAVAAPSSAKYNSTTEGDSSSAQTGTSSVNESSSTSSNSSESSKSKSLDMSNMCPNTYVGTAAEDKKETFDSIDNNVGSADLNDDFLSCNDDDRVQCDILEQLLEGAEARSQQLPTRKAADALSNARSDEDNVDAELNSGCLDVDKHSKNENTFNYFGASSSGVEDIAKVASEREIDFLPSEYDFLDSRHDSYISRDWDNSVLKIEGMHKSCMADVIYNSDMETEKLLKSTHSNLWRDGPAQVADPVKDVRVINVLPSDNDSVQREKEKAFFDSDAIYFKSKSPTRPKSPGQNEKKLDQILNTLFTSSDLSPSSLRSERLNSIAFESLPKSYIVEKFLQSHFK